MAGDFQAAVAGRAARIGFAFLAAQVRQRIGGKRVAVRLDQPNREPLDYYMLPRLNFGIPRINLAEQNGIEFESFRFDSLDYLHGMAERTRVRRAA